MREERGRKALGRGAVRYQMVPARLNARCAMVATQCVAFGADGMAGATTRGRVMRGFRNQGGSKRGGEIRHRDGGRISRTDRFT